ncbi:MAG: porin family protein [Alphaproteobacteria bacterium]|nr:porin family protein [Alphaproteobacteria bacterium]
MMSKNKLTAAIATGLSLTLVAAPLAANAQSSASSAQNNARWSGFYGGINLGGMWENTKAGIGMNNTGGGFNGSGSGFLGGVQGGYNWLLGPVVLGGEVDFQGSTLTSGFSGGAGPSQLNGQGSMPWFSTFRARAGYPVGSVMPYVTGGAVWGQQNLSGYDSANGGAFSASNNYWTWTVGGGVEGFLSDRWSAKLEYLYIGTPSTPLSAPATTSINETQNNNVLRVGLNYHFN